MTQMQDYLLILFYNNQRGFSMSAKYKRLSFMMKGFPITLFSPPCMLSAPSLFHTPLQTEILEKNHCPDSEFLGEFVIGV